MGRLVVGAGLLVPVWLAFRYLGTGALIPALLSLGLMVLLMWAWLKLIRGRK